LVIAAAPGNDQRYQKDRLIAGRGFINKIWNAFRFVLMNLDEGVDFGAPEDRHLRLEDRWILSVLNKTVKEVTHNLEQYELGLALSKVYSFIWDDFCDWYIEMIKPRFYDQEGDSNITAQTVALTVLTDALKMLHPFMPFVTSEIYSHLPVPDKAPDLMMEEWPAVLEQREDEEAEEQIRLIMEATRAIRTIRLDMNVPVKRSISILVHAQDRQIGELFVDSAPYLDRLAKVSEVQIIEDEAAVPEHAVHALLGEAGIHIPLSSLVDLEEERKRLEKEIERLTGERKRLEGKLANRGFVEKAPPAVVQMERDKLEKVQLTLEQTADQLKKIIQTD
jgi:valyl-tRNA synthetase